MSYYHVQANGIILETTGLITWKDDNTAMYKTWQEDPNVLIAYNCSDKETAFECLEGWRKGILMSQLEKVFAEG
jgi:hypothetical protein